MNPELTELEEAVLVKLVAGEWPELVELRKQLSSLRVISRTFTGAGFYTKFNIPPRGLASSGKTFSFGDVTAEIEGLMHGAGFTVFVSEGYLDVLEGFTFDEPWPPEIQGFRVSYLGGATPGATSGLRPCNDRDWVALSGQLRPNV